MNKNRVPAPVINMAFDIVKREGGFVDHPNDPGGATKFGVTIHTLRRLGFDVDGDGDIDRDDVKALTIDEAVRIFVDKYFYDPKIDMLPEILWPVMFDMSVHSGGNAVKVLQRTLNRVAGRIGFKPLAVDGAIGPVTARAARLAADRMGQYLVDAVSKERRDWLLRLARNNPKLRVFAVARSGGKGGWIKRAESFMRPRYHLTPTQWEKIRRSM